MIKEHKVLSLMSMSLRSFTRGVHINKDSLNCSLLSVILSLLTGVPVNQQILDLVRVFIPKKSIDLYKVNLTFVQPFFITVQL